MQSSNIVIVGSHAPGLFMRVQRIPGAGETVIGWDYQEPVDGGKGSNQAIAAARLGGKVAFVGRIGNDRLGREAEDWLRRESVDISHLSVSDTLSTGIGFILLDQNGVPAMVTSMGANAELSEQNIEQALSDYAGAKVMMTQLEIDPAIAFYALHIAHQRGMTTILNPAPATEVTHDFQDVDILIPNETEAKILAGFPVTDEIEPETLGKVLLEKTGVPCVMLTLGEKGVYYIDRQQQFSYSPPAVSAVDTSGAGDMFCATVAVALTEGMTMAEAARRACIAAAVSVELPGTIPAYPTKNILEQFIADLPTKRE